MSDLWIKCPKCIDGTIDNGLSEWRCGNCGGNGFVGVASTNDSKEVQRELDTHKAARQSYANLFDGEVGMIHENIRNLKAENKRLKKHNDKLIRICLKILEGWWPLVWNSTCRETVKAEGKELRHAISNTEEDEDLSY